MFSKADVIAAFAGHLQTSGGNEDPDKPHLMIKEEFSAYSLTTVKWPEPGPASERTKLFALTHPLENLLEALVPSRRMSGASRWLNGKEDSCQCRRHRLSLCVRGRSPGEGNVNTLQYSCLGNSTDRGAWRATVHGLGNSWTGLDD